MTVDELKAACQAQGLELEVYEVGGGKKGRRYEWEVWIAGVRPLAGGMAYSLAAVEGLVGKVLERPPAGWMP